MLAPTTKRDLGSFSLVPLAELTETEDAIHLKLEVPGMEANDLDVQVTADAVSISGERKSESKTEENGIAKSEFRYGKFQRVMAIAIQSRYGKVAPLADKRTLCAPCST